MSTLKRISKMSSGEEQSNKLDGDHKELSIAEIINKDKKKRQQNIYIVFLK